MTSESLREARVGEELFGVEDTGNSWRVDTLEDFGSRSLRSPTEARLVMHTCLGRLAG